MEEVENMLEKCLQDFTSLTPTLGDWKWHRPAVVAFVLVSEPGRIS